MLSTSKKLVIRVNERMSAVIWMHTSEVAVLNRSRFSTNTLVKLKGSGH